MEHVPDSKCNTSSSGRNGAAETLVVDTEEDSNPSTEQRESSALHMDSAENIPGDFDGIGTSSPGARTKDSLEQERNVKVSVSESEDSGVLPAGKSGRVSDTKTLLDSNSEEVRNYLDLETYGCYARVGGVWFHAKTLRLLSGCRSIHEVLLVDHEEILEIQSCDLINHFGDIPLEDKVDSYLVEKLKSKKLSREDELLVTQFQVEISKYDIKKSWEAGKKCFAVWSEDSTWYNARILHNDKVLKKITVQFTDYGNEDIATYDNVVENFNCIADTDRIDPYIMDRGVNVLDDTGTDNGFGQDQQATGNQDNSWASTGFSVENILDVNGNRPILATSPECFEDSAETMMSKIYEPCESTASAASVSVRSVNMKLNFLSLPRILQKKFEILNVAGPIGVAVLPGTETILVACRNADQVLKFSRNGDCIGSLNQNRKLIQPIDILLMKSGSILIRDSSGIQMFDSRCEFVKNIGDLQMNKYFGLAESEDHIITINLNSGGHGRITEAGKTDLFYFDKVSGKLDLRVVMDDVIGENENSQLTNLACDDGRLYVIDKKDDRIYCLSLEDGEEGATAFGDSEVLDNPSCMIVDDYGTMMITDSGSNRLLLFDTNLKYCGELKVSKVLTDFQT